jgi:hypothetical protein
MEILLKSKGLWKYAKIALLDPTNDQEKFSIDGKKDEAVGVNTTYISQEIHFHLSVINWPHQFWKKLNSLFDRINESHFMQLEKELISLDPHSFDIRKDCLEHVKEL